MEKFEQNTAKVLYVTTTHLLRSFSWADNIESSSTSKYRPAAAEE